MKFVIVDVENQSATLREFEDLEGAKKEAGLKRHQVDHGCLWLDPDRSRGMSVVVYEFGLMEPDEQQHFSINGQLYAGNAVLYSHVMGETVDVEAEDIPTITFIGGRAEVEEAIANNEVSRPDMRANGEVVWEWGRGR